MLEESTAEGVNIGIRVFNFSKGSKNTGNGVEAGSCQVADIVILDVSISKWFQVHESGIGVSQDCMTVAGDNSSLSQGFSDILLNNFRARFLSFMVFLEGSKPLEAFLVSKTVKRSSQSIHSGRVREIGIGKCRSNKHVGMSWDISSFMIRVNSQISSDTLFHLRFIIS